MMNMPRYTEEFSWLASMFGREKAHRYAAARIRDETPGSFEAYGRILPPVEIRVSEPACYRWSEIARLTATKLSAADTSWDDLIQAIVSANDGPLQHVNANNIWPHPWEMPRKWRSVIGSILSTHGVSDVTFGVWDGYEPSCAPFPCHRYIALDFRDYHAWSGTCADFGRFHAHTPYGRIFPQDIAWPTSRSWFYRIDTDWSSALIAGTHEMIASLVAACEIEVLEIDGCLPSAVLDGNRATE